MRRVRALAPICPRCNGYIPNNEQAGEYPGALSRVDNKTEVCSACGQAEALEQMLLGATALDYSEWKNPPNEFEADLTEMLEAEALLVKNSPCAHTNWWKWLDCEECRETIGHCGEKICGDCGEKLDI